MSLGTGVGAERNLLDETPEHAHQLVMDQPILRNHELETLRNVSHDVFRAHTIDITWPVERRARRARQRGSPRSATRPTTRSPAGANILILSDRRVGTERVGDPVAARRRRRAPPPRARGHAPARGSRARVRRAARGPPLRDAHRLRRAARSTRTCCFDTVDELVAEGRIAGRRPTSTQAQSNVVKAIGKGLLKTISKMGISTIQSYCGAQIFEAVGLERDLIDRTSPAPRRASAASASTSSRARRSTATPQAYPAGRTRTCCRSAASTRGAATASSTCGTRRRSRCCSTRCASENGDAQQKYDEYAAHGQRRRARAARRCAGS